MKSNQKFQLSGEAIGLPALAVAYRSRFHETLNRDWHTHDYDEYHYLITGVQTFEINPPSNRKMVLTGEHFLHIPAKMPHRVLPDNGTPTIRLTVGWQAATILSDAGVPFTPSERADIHRQICELSPSPRPLSNELSQAVHNFSTLMRTPTDPLTLRIAGWQLLLSTAHASAHRARSRATVLDGLSHYLERNLADKIKMDDVARHFGLSRRSLFFYCNERYGISPLQLLTLARINAAKKMLLSPKKKTLIEIALDCGFCSASHFSSTFRRYTGTVPKNWRA